MKRIRQQVIMVVAACLLLAATTILNGFESEAAGKTVRSIKITNTATGYVLPVRKTRVLKIKTVPRVSKKRLKFTSSNKAVATINKAGKIRAKQPGSTVIKVTSRSKKKRQKSFRLYVGQRVTKLTYSSVPSGSVMIKGASFRMRTDAAPANAAYKGVTWSSSNKKILTVTAGGVVKAKAYGSATITARAKDGSGKKVSKKISVVKKITSVKVSSSLKHPYMQVGGTAQMSVTVTPTGASRAVTWSSSNKSVATVNSAGKVTAKALGQAVIKATAKDGSKKAGSYTVNVCSLSSRAGEAIAHRGYSGVAPENTLTAFQLAAGQNFGGIECDVRMTADEANGDDRYNRFVLSHDNSLSRVFGSSQLVSASKYEDIKDLVAISGNNVARYPNERLCTLKQYMDVIKSSGKKAVIEIKVIGSQEGSNDFYDLISSYGINDRVEIISFEAKELIRLETAIATYQERHSQPEDEPEEENPKEELEESDSQGETPTDPSDEPEVEEPVRPAISYLAGTPTDSTGIDSRPAIQWALDNGYGFSLKWTSVTPAVVNQVHAAGQRITAWTINAFDVAYYLSSIGVDRITSNYNLFR